MTTISTYNFDGAAVRTTTGADGEPWFVAADVAAVLDYRMASDMTRILDDDEKGTHIVSTLGGDQELTTISEAGLYAAILKSRKPEAKRFKKWVTSEVLPSIRKTGTYGVAADPMAVLSDPAAMRALLLGYTEKVIALQDKVEVLAPKADALDRFATVTDGSFCLTDAAKTLQVPPRKFIAKLQELRWIYRRPMGSGWLAHQERINQCVMEHKVTTGDKSNGTEWANTQARITAKGMARLALVFTNGGAAA